MYKRTRKTFALFNTFIHMNWFDCVNENNPSISSTLKYTHHRSPFLSYSFDLQIVPHLCKEIPFSIIRLAFWLFSGGCEATFLPNASKVGRLLHRRGKDKCSSLKTCLTLLAARHFLSHRMLSGLAEKLTENDIAEIQLLDMECFVFQMAVREPKILVL